MVEIDRLCSQDLIRVSDLSKLNYNIGVIFGLSIDYSHALKVSVIWIVIEGYRGYLALDIKVFTLCTVGLV